MSNCLHSIIELRFFINRGREFLKKLLHDPFSIFSRNDFYTENNSLVARDIHIEHRTIELFSGNIYFKHDIQGQVTYIFKDYRGFKIKVLMRLERFSVDTDLIRIKIVPEQSNRIIYYDDLVLFSEAVKELFETYFLENNYEFKISDLREISGSPYKVIS